MGKSKLTQAQLFIMFLLKDDLAAQLKRLNLLRNVVKVDSCCTFLEKFSALHPYLVEFFHVSRLVLQLIDAVALVWLILLRHDNLFQTHRCFFGSSDQRLVEACDVAVRDTDRPESSLSQ